MANSITAFFSEIPDARSEHGKRPLLSDMIAIAVCAVVCGAEGWVDVELFGHAKESWLATFLRLPHGIPSHDTFGRVFAALEPDPFSRCSGPSGFAPCSRERTSARAGLLVGGSAIAGKTLRRSFVRAGDKPAIH